MLTNNPFNAVTRDDADLFFRGTHQARFEKTSITVNRNTYPSLSFFSFDKSTRSACHWWLRPPTMTRRLLSRILTDLCKVYASCSDNHCLTAFTGARVTRLNALTPRAGSSQRSCTARRQVLLSVGSSRRSCTALLGLPSDMCPLPIPWLTVESS